MKALSILSTLLVWAPLPGAADILQVEYYLDTDPGYGNGTQVAITPSDSLNLSFSADLSDLEPGIHVLYARALDDSSRWSLARSHPFVLEAAVTDQAPAITAIEYYFAADSALTAPRTFSDFTPTVDLALDFAPDLSGLETGSTYALHLLAADALGRRSLEHVESFQAVEHLARLTGDFDTSGAVDFADFFLFADAFGTAEVRFDLDESGSVDFGDFFLFADNFGRSVEE
jgi:hypothetical protein